MIAVLRISFTFLLLSMSIVGHASDIPNFSTFLKLASSSCDSNVSESNICDQIPLISGLKPTKNPGPQPDVGLLVEERNIHEVDEFSKHYPSTDFSADKWSICRLDYLDDCAIGSPRFRQRLKNEIAAHEPHFLRTDIDNPFLFLESLNDGSYMIHLAPLFPPGSEKEIIAAIIDEGLSVQSIFRIALSSSNGVNTGHESGDYTADVQIVGAARLQDSLIIAIDSTARCGDGQRKLGFLVRFRLTDYQVKWITPFNTASAKFAIVDDLIYSPDGGSCEKDYLYAIDANTGHVVARDIVPTAFNWLFSENGRLFGQTYDGGFVYRLQ